MPCTTKTPAKISQAGERETQTTRWGLDPQTPVGLGGSGDPPIDKPLSVLMQVVEAAVPKQPVPAQRKFKSVQSLRLLPILRLAAKLPLMLLEISLVLQTAPARAARCSLDDLPDETSFARRRCEKGSETRNT